MRLDLYLTEHKLAKSRTKAKEYIEGGLVRVDGKVWTARCEDKDRVIEKDAEVEVLRIEGVKVIVK